MTQIDDEIDRKNAPIANVPKWCLFAALECRLSGDDLPLTCCTQKTDVKLRASRAQRNNVHRDAARPFVLSRVWWVVNSSCLAKGDWETDPAEYQPHLHGDISRLGLRLGKRRQSVKMTIDRTSGAISSLLRLLNRAWEIDANRQHHLAF